MFVNEHGKVLDIAGGADRDGTRVICWNMHKGLNQQWEITYVTTTTTVTTKFEWKVNRPFTIVNQMNHKRLLTLKGGNFVIQDRDNSPEQLFVFDQETKTINTYSNQGRSISIQHEGKGRNIVSHDSDGAWYQIFNIDGTSIKNERGLVLSVEGGDKSDINGQNVVAW